tara:strand:+ start:1141 stop:1662 length:522 start_codon:yes stop_codon:yes gene_type:complete
MKKLFLIVFTALSMNVVVFASFPVVVNEISIEKPCDNIILINGEEISAKVIEINPDFIKYKKCDNLDGPLISIYKSEVLMLRYKDGSKDLFNNEIINKKNIKRTPSTSAVEGVSILSLLLAVFGLFIALALPLGIAAVILGVIGMKKDNKLLAVAIIGAIIGFIDIILILSVL